MATMADAPYQPGPLIEWPSTFVFHTSAMPDIRDCGLDGGGVEIRWSNSRSTTFQRQCGYVKEVTQVRVYPPLFRVEVELLNATPETVLGD